LELGVLSLDRDAKPVLLVFADNDSVSQKHVADFLALLGGGVKEPGWLNTQLSKSWLAVVPGYSPMPQSFLAG
jgi:hypothetical protein